MGWDTSSYQTVVQTDFEEGDAITEDLMETIGSNLEYLDAQRILQVNAWRDDDIRIHFNADETSYSEKLTFATNNGTFTHDEDDHFIQMDCDTVGNDFPTVSSKWGRRIDKVETTFRARVKVSSHATTVHPFVGFTNTPGNDHDASTPSDGAWFERGMNSNTWLCRTRSGSTDRTTTDNQSGNYTGWDELMIAYTANSVKFYINETLVANHTTSTPDTVLLYAFVQLANDGGPTPTLYLDRFELWATENADSA